MEKLLTSIPDDWQELDSTFFARPAPEVARDLLTCVLLRKHGKGWMGGPICETEAYMQDDPASHSFTGKRDRNKSMFESPGTIYVYRSYGIHYCLNVTTGKDHTGEAVLIRAIAPAFGTNAMIRGASPHTHKLGSGPGRLCAALQIDITQDGQVLGKNLAIYKTQLSEAYELATGQRVGISKALDRHWRFGIKNHPSLSKPFPSRVQAKTKKKQGPTSPKKSTRSSLKTVKS